MTKNKKLIIIIWSFLIVLTSFACRTLDGSTPDSILIATSTPEIIITVEVLSTEAEEEIIPTSTFTPTATKVEIAVIETEEPDEPVDVDEVQQADIQPTATLIAVATQVPITLNFENLDEEEVGTGEQRPGPSVDAVYQETPPEIDGDPGDWVGIWYSAAYPTFGQGYYAGYDDLSAEFKIGWDQDYLYIGLVVRDTYFAQQATGSQIYRGDSLEIFIDSDLAGDFSNQRLNEDDYQFGFSPGNLLNTSNSEAFIWAPKYLLGSIEMGISVGRLTEDGYLMEVALPWAIMDIEPVDGQHFGFLLSVSDNDTPFENAQHSVVSFSPDRLLHDPTSWKDLVLKP